MKLFKTILLFLFFSIASGVFSYYEKVQDVFSDIGNDYTYLSELQSLYDKGVIFPDVNGKFNPTKLLTRDEFVGIVMEVSCKDCIKPNTALEYISKYTGKEIFYDVPESNKFFYCIASGKDEEVVKGYGPGYTCDDQTHKDGQNPFCTNNNITLEEALAVLLRNSSVFTIYDNNNVIAQIQAGTLTQDLAKDLKVKNLDGSVYTFYGYFQKALDLKYEEYDVYGKLKKYSLVEVDTNGNLNPKKYVSKEEFLKMSYIISKMNSCSKTNNVKTNTSIAGKIDIFEKTCTSGTSQNCSLSPIDDNAGEYDFSGNIKSTCSSGIKSYTWVFYNQNNGTFVVKNGQYIDNFKLPSFGVWQVKLMVEDNCGNKVDLKSQVSYFDTTIKKSENDIGVSIVANPMVGYGPLKVNFDSVVSNCPSCKYDWSFGDNAHSSIKSPDHIYPKVGTYDVELVVIDEDGNTGKANVVIHVLQNQDDINSSIDALAKKYPNISPEDIQKLKDGKYNEVLSKYPEAKKEIGDLIQQSQKTDYTDTMDSDNDGTFDNTDKCPTVKGDAKNLGCPILDTSCNEMKPCKGGYSCNTNGVCEVDKTVNADLAGSCIYPSTGSSVFGNLICDTCPCEYKIDFLASLRKCDIVVPAIVSPDKSEIYGRGEPYQIPYTK